MDCIFCKIVSGKIPCYKTYEDADFLGFLDIGPKAKGHTLLIPKKHYRWVYDVPNFGEYFEVARKICLAQIKAFKCHHVKFVTLGELVHHAHIHIIPQFDDADQEVFLGKNIQIDKEKMAAIAKEIFAKM